MLVSKWHAEGQQKLPKLNEHYSCYVAPENCVYVFGGFDQTTVNTELFCFSLNTDTWQKIGNTQGEKPDARSHGALIFRSLSNSLIMFGGFRKQVTNEMYELDLTSKKWTCCNQDQQHCPAARSEFGHVYVEQSDTFFVFGGRCKAKMGEFVKSWYAKNSGVIK